MRYSASRWFWRDGGVAERAGLENRILRKRDGGSNPSLSATNENPGRFATENTEFIEEKRIGSLCLSALSVAKNRSF